MAAKDPSQVSENRPSEPSGKKRRLNTIYEYGTELSKAVVNTIKQGLARFVIRKCLPFNHFENDPDITKAFRAAGIVTIKPPTAHYISHERLDVEFEVTKEKVEGYIVQELGFTLTMDGWTDVTHRGLVNVIAATPNVLNTASSVYCPC